MSIFKLYPWLKKSVSLGLKSKENDINDVRLNQQELCSLTVITSFSPTRINFIENRQCIWKYFSLLYNFSFKSISYLR